MAAKVVALVASKQQGQFVGVKSMTPGQPAWLAWQLLPRNQADQPPSWRSIEKAVGLSNSTITRFIWDEKKLPGPDTLRKLAEGLGVTVDWLWYGEGPGPTIIRPVIPRPPERVGRGTPYIPPGGEILALPAAGETTGT